MANFRSAYPTFAAAIRLLVICLSLVVPAPTVASTARPTISCALTISAYYTVGKWAPVTIRLSNPTDNPIDGFIQFGPGRDNDLIARQPVHVPARSSLAIDTVIQTGVADRRSMPAGEITRAVWIDASGKELCRESLSGIRIGIDPSGKPKSTADLPTTSLLVLDTLSPKSTDGSAPIQSSHLDDFISAEEGKQAERAVIASVDLLPRSVMAYAGYDYVLLATPPDDLDPPQRQALLGHIRQGATLIVSGAFRSAALEDSWLARYLPVEIVGYREASWLRSSLPRGHNIPLLNTTEISEAILSPGTDDGFTCVALRDGSYILAAFRQLGFGRVIFTSFPSEALDLTDPAARTIWRELLDSENAVQPLSARPQVREKATMAMSQLLGRSTPAWSVAATVAGGYALAVLAAQLFFTGTRRPVAFALAGAISFVISAGVVLASALRPGEKTITGGRLTWVDLARDGSGQMQEQIAFYGANPPSGCELTSALSQVECCPIGFDSHDSPTEEPIPFKTNDVGIRSDGIGRIWQATAPYSGESVHVHGTFGSSGLQLLTDNHLHSVIQSPLLVWGPSIIPAGDMPTGQNQLLVRAADLNTAATFMHGSGIVTSSELLRGELVRDAVTPPTDEPSNISAPAAPLVIGWLPDGSLPPLLHLESPNTPLVHGQTMIRMPLVIDPSPAGSVIQVDGPFNRLARYADTAMPPLDARGNASGIAEQSWLINVIPPSQLGRLNPVRATLSVNLDTPESTVVVKAHQFDRKSLVGSFTVNEDAPVLASWNHAIGRHAVAFDVTPADLSPQGTLVLQIAVQSPGGSAGPMHWSMQQLSVSLVSVVAASVSNGQSN